MQQDQKEMTKGKLLVVEDEPNLLLGIRDILILEQYDVVTASNGKKALEVLQEFSDDELPDLILSDIMMPFMNGIELLQEVRKRVEWVTIPFIFLTAKGEKADVKMGKMVGVDDYLIKPFDADELLVAVDAKLRRIRAINDVHKGAISAVKRQIMTILNHEFRTPLTLVVAYSEMLKDYDINSMGEDELLLFLREVNNGAERLRRLVENFILLVELQSGETQNTYEWRKDEITDIADIVQTAFTQVLPPAKGEHRCTLSVPPDLPAIIGDREFLVVILRELLLNAVKFSKPDAPIAIEAETVDDQLHIRVIDNGRGIAPSELDLIWNSFYQIDREQFEDQGAGSGLVIAQGLARLHNGTIDVQSEVGKGSCFTLKLPPLPSSGD
jgi:two-component system sensor histidine kinase/response regulator